MQAFRSLCLNDSRLCVHATT